MTYSELKEMNINDAISLVYAGELNAKISAEFPMYPDVVIFGDEYWKTYEGMAEFLKKYVDPKCEKDVSDFFAELAIRIASDIMLSDSTTLKNTNIVYQLLYQQYRPLFASPSKRIDFAESIGTYIWNEYILSERRKEQFEKIKKKQDNKKMDEISATIKKIYKFSQREITYLQYFCSQVKLDDLDPSFNTFLYLWGEKKTGKSTVSDYICSYLNGETRRNAEPHKSKLSTELQFNKFDRPKAIYSRCTMIDDGGFHDMTKSYDVFKQSITSNSCEIEYKYKSSHVTKRCYRNYIFNTNHNPIYFVKDDDERRISPVFFKKPEQVDFKKLDELWKLFVLECNLSAERLEEIYNNVIMENMQIGESKNIGKELKDILTIRRIESVSQGSSYFSISNIMGFPEIQSQRLTRKLVKEAVIELYGNPDDNQRFYKSKRHVIENENYSENEIENIGDGLPF